MATRPVFVPQKEGKNLVFEVSVDFPWSPGMAPSQKKKNIQQLHEQARSHGLTRLLEISTKSEDELGRRLSAFNLKLRVEGQDTFLECAYQGSKVFRHGGPFTDIFSMSAVEAKRDKRLRSSGNLIALEYMGEIFPIFPKNAFYDWLYIKALLPHKIWLSENVSFQGYTDIEFNPAKSINCQARAFAELIALAHRKQLERVGRDFSYFASLLEPI